MFFSSSAADQSIAAGYYSSLFSVRYSVCTLVWVGFELMLRSWCIGIWASRADWFVRWTEKIANSSSVHLASFVEGLGRFMFVTQERRTENPFLCYVFSTLSVEGDFQEAPLSRPNRDRSGSRQAMRKGSEPVGFAVGFLGDNA